MSTEIRSWLDNTPWSWVKILAVGFVYLPLTNVWIVPPIMSWPRSTFSNQVFLSYLTIWPFTVCIVCVAMWHCVLYWRYSRVCYNEGMLQGTVSVNKIRMLQRTQMLQWTRRNTNGRRSTRMHMTCRVFPLWLERQSFVKFSCLFSSVTRGGW